MTDFNEEFRQTFEAIKRVVNRCADREDSEDFEELCGNLGDGVI
jgi:hypothetical protein